MEARKELFLVSPYLQLSKTFHERLMDASSKGVIIHLIYGKDELKPNERNSLAKVKSLKMYYFENLHAKCYFNEHTMVITSMNMYEFSEKNNREMGVLIRLAQDVDLFEKAKFETLSIIKNSEINQPTRVERKFFSEPLKQNSIKGQFRQGYCIRCETRIPHNPSKPYCSDCFMVWSQFENPYYEESVCHSCGEFVNSSMERPLCYGCFKSNSF